MMAANGDWGWVEILLETADKFITTPKEQMEYEAQLARARADESLAAAQLAAAGQQNQMLNTALIGVAVVGVGVLMFQMLK